MTDPTPITWNYEVVAPARPYYDRLSDDLALEIAREWVDEWSYDNDPGGYCHFRSVVARLITLSIIAQEGPSDD